MLPGPPESIGTASAPTGPQAGMAHEGALHSRFTSLHEHMGPFTGHGDAGIDAQTVLRAEFERTAQISR